MLSLGEKNQGENSYVVGEVTFCVECVKVRDGSLLVEKVEGSTHEECLVSLINIQVSKSYSYDLLRSRN